jgi:hypothetical protein
MIPAIRQPVVITTSTVTETTVSSGRMAITFAVCTAGGFIRWSISARVKSGGAARRLEIAIQRVDPAAEWSRRTSQEWSCTGGGWTEQHRALIELAVELARFGGGGWGDA